MASFTHEIPRSESGRPTRPSFRSSITADRLRESERRPSLSQISRSQPRRSIFREEKLDDMSPSVHDEDLALLLEHDSARGSGQNRNSGETTTDPGEKSADTDSKTGDWWFSRRTKPSRPVIKSSASAPPGAVPFTRIALVALLVAVVAPSFRNGGKDGVEFSGADAGVIPTAALVENAALIDGRADSPTAVCTRWSQQVANVNGTVYIYGGQESQQSGQTANTWNNNFLTLDLTKSWDIASPAISALPQPSGPPAVALGSLWHSYDTLWLYGGMFSDTPPAQPAPVSTWEYSIKNGAWTEQGNPQTSAGNFSDGGNVPVQRAAEGAGLSVPEIGRSWYFGGHLDLFTTPGWSNQIARVYLKSLLEFTHPGYPNTGVNSLGNTNGAGSTGVYRNITEGGLQAEAGFTERADGVLVYVPGWGDDGIVLGLAGGTNETFTEMNIIDVFDIASSTWYKQATSGPAPPIRVDPCAVVASAPDGTSFNVYLYGGQDLTPAGNQAQYSDMWILTIPSFTWIQVELDGQSQPPARAGHSCVMWDGQMVVIGGYVGKSISCDPGFYVFNASSLQWTNSFTALSAAPSTDDQGSSVLQGSDGYQVPAPVQSVIGGNSQGGATATQPAAGSASTGPIATGKPPTFTVTQSGSTIIQTSQSTATISSTLPGTTVSSPPSIAPKTKNVGAIIAGVIAGLLALVAAYLAFCMWLYRRQLQLYKNHVAMAQRTAFASSPETGNSGNRNEKLVPVRAAYGPFGTEINPSARLSEGSSALGMTDSSGPSPYSHADSAGFVGISPLSSVAANPGRASMGYEGADVMGAERLGSWDERRRSGSSSLEDLIGGQEPNFFSVVLNPRRTLRVVNLD